MEAWLLMSRGTERGVDYQNGRIAILRNYRLHSIVVFQHLSPPLSRKGYWSDHIHQHWIIISRNHSINHHLRTQQLSASSIVFSNVFRHAVLHSRYKSLPLLFSLRSHWHVVVPPVWIHGYLIAVIGSIVCDVSLNIWVFDKFVRHWSVYHMVLEVL